MIKVEKPQAKLGWPLSLANSFYTAFGLAPSDSQPRLPFEAPRKLSKVDYPNH